MEKETITTDAESKERFRYFLTRSIKYHAVQKREDFDPHTLSPKEIDVLLAERDTWILFKKKADEDKEDMSKLPVYSYVVERLETINDILKRLAN